jgi:hypothetical protein
MAHKFHDKRKLRIIYTHVVPMLELEPWDKEGSDVYRLRGENKERESGLVSFRLLLFYFATSEFTCLVIPEEVVSKGREKNYTCFEKQAL